MNRLLLNRDGFQMPADGWYQMAPLGEFAHAHAGLVQVVDRDACETMVNQFRAEAQASHFAGLLVDFDHFSLDGEKRSEAAGWITDLENRESGLFAKIRWSDVGEEAVKGGRYRFLSPVWARSDCVDLGNGRVRPVRLLNAAVTNDPNLKGMVPLSNSGAATGGEPRFKWVLGETPEGRHCPSCMAVSGQVHTMAEWEAAGVKPGAGGLYCQGNCHCRLEPTSEASSGLVTAGPLREETSAVKNAAAVARGAETAGAADVLSNIGWTDAARAASIAVRRAKAAARASAGETNSSDVNDPPDEKAAGQARLDTALARISERQRVRKQNEGRARRMFTIKAASAFKKKYGRYPMSHADYAEAEELAQVPDKFREYERSRSAEGTKKWNWLHK